MPLVTCAGPGSRLYVEAGAASAYLIENPIASPTTLEVLYPLPTASSAATSYQRMLAAGIPWEIGIGVLGGSPPYYVSDSTLPSGMAVEYSDGYSTGVPPFDLRLVWDNPGTGAFSASITVTDQVGADVTVSWSGEVYAATDTTRFCFINSATGNNSNTGTRASPKLNCAGAFGTTEDDSTNANKVVYFDGGTYDLGGSGVEEDGPRVSFNNTKSKAWIGIPGTSPTLNLNGTYINTDITSRLYIANLTIAEPAVSDGGTRHIHIQAGRSFVEGGLHKVTFVGDASAISATNNCCVMFNDESETHEGCSMTELTFDSLDGQAGIQNYNFSRLVINATAVDCTDATLVHDKGGDIADVQVSLVAISGNTTCVGRKSEWINDPIQRTNLTMFYSNIDVGGLMWDMDGQSGDNYAGCLIARCNLKGSQIRQDAGSGTLTVSHCVIEHSSGSAINNTGTGGSVANTDNAAAGSGLLDGTTNLLTGDARTTHLGDKGCEVVFL